MGELASRREAGGGEGGVERERREVVLAGRRVDEEDSGAGRPASKISFRQSLCCLDFSALSSGRLRRRR